MQQENGGYETGSPQAINADLIWPETESEVTDNFEKPETKRIEIP